MKTQTWNILLACVLLCAATLPAYAGDDAFSGGRIVLPLGPITHIGHETDENVAYGRGTIQVQPSGQGDSYTVRVQFRVEISGDDAQNVPVLPAGVALDSFSTGGSATLRAEGANLVWVNAPVGAHNIAAVYQVEARSGAGMRRLDLPLPPVPGSGLVALLAEEAAEVSVTPGEYVRSSESGSQTRVEATLPLSPRVSLTWRDAAAGAARISRAEYAGRDLGEAIEWRVLFTAHGGSAGRVPLLPQSHALLGVRVNGEDAPLNAEEGWFVVTLPEGDRHEIEARFQTPIYREEGPPLTRFAIPPVPVSRFSLELDGDKEVTVTPGAHVEHTKTSSHTVAGFNIPMGNSVVVAWSEAIPEDPGARLETIASAELYQVYHADEGVLHGRCVATFDVTRGEANQFTLTVPAEAQIVRVESLMAGVTDWRVSEGNNDADGELTVFLDRPITGAFRFDVFFERALVSTDDADVSVPLFAASDVTRQRGMVALLSSRELGLAPVDGHPLTRVGENQLPGFVRDDIEMTIAHTFRYFDAPGALSARTATPERVLGRFDARVDTLVSMADVTTRFHAAVTVDVKSGSVMELHLKLEESSSVLQLSAPSLRAWSVNEDDPSLIVVEFTEEMEGEFRIDVAYEKIEEDGSVSIGAPLLHVEGAEVEEGRVAVEALSAIEVEPSVAENLRHADISELPSHLVMRTSNPILLAYKYFRVEPLPVLALNVTRHREMDLQAAAIERAHYTTLVGKDGLHVTAARFEIRNTRRQFVRLRLPDGSDVWSLRVAGTDSTPAIAADDPNTILVNLLHSEDGFNVELVYATPASSIGAAGNMKLPLASSDMVTSELRWDVYLPDGYRWLRPRSPLSVIAGPERVDSDEIGASLTHVFSQGRGVRMPTSGYRVSFERLYAGDAQPVPELRMRYARADSRAQVFAIALIIAFLSGLLIAVARSRSLPLAVVGVGLAALSVAASWKFALAVWPSAVVFVGALALALIATKLAGSRASKTV